MSDDMAANIIAALKEADTYSLKCSGCLHTCCDTANLIA